MAVYHIYGDESGKLKSTAERTSFCGYVGHIGMWEAFSNAWRDCRFKWQVPPIHMARIMFPERKEDAWKKVYELWGGQWADLRDQLLKELAEIVFESRIICVGAVVDAKHFRKICDVDKNFKKLHRDPIRMAFHTFLMAAIDRIETVDQLSSIGLVIDNDAEFAKDTYDQFENLKQTALYDKCDKEMARRFARIKDRVHAISFVNDDSYPGVQAADMIAYEARRSMVERISNPNFTSDLYDRLTFGRIHQPKYYTADVLDGLHASLREGIADGSITV